MLGGLDMDSGLYVDITAVRYSLIEEEGEGMLYDKSGHRYRVPRHWLCEWWNFR